MFSIWTSKVHNQVCGWQSHSYSIWCSRPSTENTCFFRKSAILSFSRHSCLQI